MYIFYKFINYNLLQGNKQFYYGIAFTQEWKQIWNYLCFFFVFNFQ